jgi:hypothetical protein
MARRQLSVHENVSIVKNMYRLQYPVQVQRLWCKEMENNPPTRPTINALMKKFEETGSVLDISPSGRPVSVTGQNVMDKVSEILAEDSQTSTRRMGLQLNISQFSVRTIYEKMGLKPYVPRLIHELNEDDFDRRIEFCETFFSLLDSDPDLVSRII